MPYKQLTSPFAKNGPARCWNRYKPVKGKDAYEEGSCAPAKKSCGPKKGTKGGGTRKVCLPKAKIASMSASERKSVVSAKQSAANKGDYKRSSESNVSGTASKNLKDWVKQDWRQVGDPSKKCGE